MATAAAKKKASKTSAKAGGSMADRLSKLRKGKAAPKKKGGKPDVRLTCTQEITEYAEQLRAKKDAEAKLADLGQIISEEANEQIVSESRRAGAVQSSLRLNGKLTFIAPGNRYCAISLDDDEKVEAIKEKFGADAYEGYFNEGHEVKLNVDLDDDVLNDLVELCEKRGIDFEEMFSVKSVVKPTELFTSDRITKAGVQASFDEAVAEGLVKPYKATLKE